MFRYIGAFERDRCCHRRGGSPPRWSSLGVAGGGVVELFGVGDALVLVDGQIHVGRDGCAGSPTGGGPTGSACATVAMPNATAAAAENATADTLSQYRAAACADLGLVMNSSSHGPTELLAQTPSSGAFIVNRPPGRDHWDAVAISAMSTCCHRLEARVSVQKLHSRRGFASVFQAFGISPAAASAYRALLRDPYADVYKLAAEDGDAAQAIAELDRHGLLKKAPDGVHPFGVVPPERALEILISEEEAALERRLKALTAARSGVDDLVAEFVDGRRLFVGELVEQIRGSDAVRSRLYQLSEQCTREVCSINPGPAPPEQALQASRRMERQSLARGILSRSVFSESAVADPAMSRHLAKSVAAGDKVRVHPMPPLRMLLIDGETGVIPIDADDHPKGAYVLHGSALLSPLTILFDTVWRAAQRFDPTTEPLAASDDARIRQVVVLLAEGYKDEAIARRLTVSVRTVRRLIALAVEQLQAESRFQAGVLAARRGWLTAPGDVAGPVEQPVP